MIIRSITHEEVQGFIDCYKQVFKTLNTLPEEYVKTQIESASSSEFHKNLLKEMDNPDNILLATTDNKNIIGIAWGRIREDGSSWLSFLGVIKTHRRLGLGRALLKRFIEECKKKGSKRISLDTDPSLIPAIRLYESMGFFKMGSVKNPFGLELIIYNKNIT